MAGRRVVNVFFALCVSCILFGAGVGKELEPQDSTVKSVSITRGTSFLSGHRYVPNELLVKFREPAANRLKSELLKGTQPDQVRLSRSFEQKKNSLRVKRIKRLFPEFERNCRRLEASQRRQAGRLSILQQRKLQRLKRAKSQAKAVNLDRIYKLEVELENSQSLEDLLAEYNEDPDIEYAELNYIVSINVVPNDPLFPLQWSLNNTGQMYPESGNYNHPPGTPDCDIDAPQAWSVSTGLSDVIIAVVDTGVYYGHRDLQNSMWINEAELNGSTEVDDDDNGYVDDIYGYDFYNDDGDPNDDNGHGTHCAGIIAAEPNNGLDITGICWNAEVMSLKFLDRYGYGDIEDAATAFYYAVENGAEIISNSWGGDYAPQTLRDAIDYANSQGVIVVAAAGNNNSDTISYPAACENVIAVAATNSNDEKATFSDYGDLVDIAAPGVDILSLRPENKYTGINYDGFTSIASGTSMACPHVAGACGLLLSANPTLSVDEVYELILQTGDEIDDGICLSDKRINVFNALNSARPSEGRVCFDSSIYSCEGEIKIRLGDYDLAYTGSHIISVVTDSGDYETVDLLEEPEKPGAFAGSIWSVAGEPNVEDGILQLSGSDIFGAIYFDVNDGSGNPATVTDTAGSDCIAPVITDVNVTRIGSGGVIIEFETDEQTTASVQYGTACGGPYITADDNANLSSAHAVRVKGLDSEMQYYFLIDVNDIAGNSTRDDNDANCFSFTTLPVMEVFVPADFNTIQEAIDSVWDGDIVTVSDGLYTGEGNRDIDFRGYAITLRSENGPENCIIDCEGAALEFHRGFYFRNGEDQNSILDGFTVKNGYAQYEGGAIECDNSSPKIRNCNFQSNSARNFGGAVLNINNSRVVLEGCIFRENEIIGGWYLYGGAAVANVYDSDCVLNECSFINNSSVKSGGALYNRYSDTELTNCSFIGNFASYYGGGICNTKSKLKAVNCLFSDNTASSESGGAVYNEDGDIELVNCTLSANIANCDSGGIANTGECSVILTNSILWSNSVGDVQDMNAQVCADVLDVNYCCIQSLDEQLLGEHNLNIDPLFIDFNGIDNILGNEDDNLRLSEFSPCLDAGNNTAVPLSVVTDLDGDERFIDEIDVNDTGCCQPPIVDMGAYEGPKQCFLLQSDTITVPENDTAEFTVALAVKPAGQIDVTVAVESGDPDITVETGGLLIFDPCDYYQPQIVSLAAAEDGDYLDGQAVVLISAAEIESVTIQAYEDDNTEIPSTIYVDVNAAGANSGSSWPHAFTDFQNALAFAAEHSDIVRQIHIAEGTYRPAGPGGDKGKAFELLENLAVYGGFPAGGSDMEGRDYQSYRTILSGDLNGDDEPNFVNTGDNSDNVVSANSIDATAVLDGLFITAATSGAMNNIDGSPTIRNCCFFNNNAVQGAGMLNVAASPQITNCIFRDNLADAGGGMYNILSSSPTLIDCVFEDNSAITGAGMENNGCSPVLEDCVFVGNSASSSGGALHNFGDSDPRLTGCTFSQNNASVNGGAVFNGQSSEPVFVNCIFSGNSASSGGAVANSGISAGPVITNCTFFANSAEIFGGGIFNISGSEPVLTSCILWNNIDFNDVNDVNDVNEVNETSQVYGGEPVINFSCIQGWSGSLGGFGNIGDDPLFAGPNDDDFHLKSNAGRWDANSLSWVSDDVNSPCIDAGDPNADWTAELWPNGKRINMGAYGGTSQASLSASNVGNIADFNIDGIVNLADFSRLAELWLREGLLLNEDISRDGKINPADLELFIDNWLWEE